jgi:uncharacterized SAM-binding protein YcdF (DUF218 family)
MSALLGYLFTAGGVVAVFALTAIWTLLTPARKGPRRLLLIVTIAYVVLSTHVFPQLASRPLIAGLHPFSADDGRERPRAIVVLGAGAMTVHGREQKLGMVTMTGAARVLETARIARLLESVPVISSGGPGPGFDMFTEAEVMRAALVDLGVPPSRIVLESRSATTHDEAVEVAPMLRSMNADPFVLVTSDIHMPRALAAFRAQGIHPIAAPARDPLDSEPRWLSYVPTRQGLDFGSAIVHEYVGLAYYKLRGWL